MRAGALAATLLVLCAAAAGCGGPSQRHRDVASYMERVSAIQLRMQKPLVEISKANRDFVQGKAKPAAVRTRLAASQATLRTLRRRLDAVDVPPDARKLHRLLLELTARQLALAGEVDALARFAPAFESALRPAAGAGRRLKAALTGKGTVAGKADALEAYGATLGVVLRRLEPLEPPPASRPVFEAQRSTLRQVRQAVRSLAAALREGRSAALPALLRRFDEAAISNQSLAAQRAQIAAVKAYNGRIRALDRLAVEIARERGALQRELG